LDERRRLDSRRRNAFEIAGRFHARSWRMDPSEEFHEQSAIAVLDIGIVLPTEIRA
jgi:hypothetical protein